ncbi:MAG: hypothetical protein H0U55_00480 [Rubrobacteraceae bacterium]|nr:hypothetical protein [Rubrobacteraceae bacterium]
MRAGISWTSSLCPARSGALVKRYLTETGTPWLTLAAADEDLVSAARSEGLTSDDPNRHP